MPKLLPNLGNKTMPRPIRISILTTGALLLVFSLISVSVFWPRIVALDWRFFEVLAFVGLPFTYIVVSALTGHTPCYWAAIALLKLEAVQWVIVDGFGLMGALCKQMYPKHEYGIREEVGRRKGTK